MIGKHPEENSSMIRSKLNFGNKRKVPLILQTEVAECGLACVAMVAGFHGHLIDLASLRREFHVSNHGSSLQHLIAIAAKLNMSARPLRVDIGNIEKVKCPCILHWGLTHFVVLKDIRNKKYILHDPAVGERHLCEVEFGKYFTGVVLELFPTQTFEIKDQRARLGLGDFWSKISGIKRSLGIVIALSLVLQFFVLLTPFYLQIVIDDVLIRSDRDLLTVLALGFGLLLLVQLATSWLRESLVIRLSTTFSVQMSSNFFRHLIKLPMDYFFKRHMGDVVSRFQSLSNVREMITNGMVVTLVDGFMALLTLGALFLYSGRLAIIVVIIVGIYICIRWMMYGAFKLVNEEAIVAEAKESSHFMESVRAIQTIKLFQREAAREHQWLNKLIDVMNKKIRIANLNNSYSIINGLLFGFENILIIYLAATLVMENMLSLGMLYAFLSYKSRFVTSVDNLINQFIDFKLLDIHFDRLSDVVYAESTDALYSEPQKIVNEKEIKKVVGKIQVINLSYRYGEQEPYIFKNVNFTILAGERVAIIGASGCGKTTLLKCLMGLITPTEGEILIDGISLKVYAGYRSQISGVMQEDRLMAGDIAENISCFSNHIDLDKIRHFSKLACIHDDIERMPMRYDTLVGDMGASLSGGQKQRIFLARALYREPQILFMDEATSHLDDENEKKINENLKALKITQIVVAHRAETIRSADRAISLTTLNATSHQQE